MKKLPVKENCTLAGRFTRLHGACSLVLKWDSNFSGDLLEEEPILLDIHGGLVPFFMTTEKGLKHRSNDLVVTLEDINSEEKAKQLLQKEVYIEYDFADEDEEEGEFDYAMGFEVHDLQSGYIGKLDDYLEIPGNPVFQILTSDGKEILIPAVDQVVKEIQTEKQIILVDLPPGLLDIYSE